MRHLCIHYFQSNSKLLLIKYVPIANLCQCIYGDYKMLMLVLFINKSIDSTQLSLFVLLLSENEMQLVQKNLTEYSTRQNKNI